jgi:hypothetical protein
MSVKTSQERIDNFFTASRIALPEKGNYQSSKRVQDAIGKVLGKKLPAAAQKETTQKLSKRKTNAKGIMHMVANYSNMLGFLPASL